MRRVLLPLAVVVALAGGACSKSKLAEGDATPTTPPTVGTGVSQTVAAPSSTTPPASLPEVCKLSDDWGLYIIRLTDPTQAGGLSPEELAANLDQAADALKAELPDHAEAVDTRTEVAKKRQDGSAGEEDTSADEAASNELFTWYSSTCQ